MTKDTTAPERIWALPFGGWDGYLEATSTGKGCVDEVEYVRADTLEAAQARIAELEEALKRISDASNHYAMKTDRPEARMRYAHKLIRNLARAALQENKNPKRAADTQKGE